MIIRYKKLDQKIKNYGQRWRPFMEFMDEFSY